MLPLFPLRTVLFPGGLLPLRVFEQRYVSMVKACLKDAAPFGVCLITRGDEVLRGTPGTPPQAPAFASVGTIASILAWDMPQLGILHLRTEGGSRFRVASHTVHDDGLVVGDVVPIPDEHRVTLPAEFRRLREFL